MIFTIITFLLFTILVAVISYVKTKDDKLDTAEGYFLASRSLSGVVIAGSLLLTNLSAEQLVGLNGQSWKSNMGPIAWEVGSMFTLLILAFYFLPRYLKLGVTTMPALMEQRYNKQTKNIFSFAIVIMYTCLNLPVILYSGALVFENIFNFSEIIGVSKFTSITILCIFIGVIGACYAIFGGLKAVAVSDTINGVGLIIGGLMIPFLGLAVLGSQLYDGGFVEGLRHLITAEPEKLNAVNAFNATEPEVPWPLIITGMLFSNIYWWCTNQSFVQRSLAAKSLKEGQKGAIFAGFLKCMGPLYLVIPGIIAYHMPSVNEQMKAINAANPGINLMDNAYPLLVKVAVPQVLMGFFAAVMFGAILSSFNSVLNSSTTMFTIDIYKGIFRPEVSDIRLVKVGKIFGTIAAIASISVSPFVYYGSSGITTLLNSLSQFLALPIMLTILGGLLFESIPTYAPKVITVFHVITYAIFLFIAPKYPGSDNAIHYLYMVAVQFPVELGIMWYLNKYHPTENTYVIKDIGAVDMTPWKYRHVVSILGIIIAISIYIFFSPLGIAA